jgi:transcriptional regulator with XRE-family HTH domain
VTDPGLTPYGEIITVVDNLPVILREARRRKQASMRDVAKETGLSLTTVSRAEAGENIRTDSMTTLLKWVQADG